MKESKDLAIVVSSCDRFSDVWPVFLTYFDKYWHDCPFPCHLITNTLAVSHQKVQTLAVGEDRHWAGNMIVALEKVQAGRVLYMQEDFLLESFVDTCRIQTLLTRMTELDGAYLRLFPDPPADEPVEPGDELGFVKRGSAYRASLQCSVWDKEVLASLLVAGETGWDMEFLGSMRSNSISRPFLALVGGASVPIQYDPDAVHRGLWRRRAIKRCQKDGVPVDLETRRVHGIPYELYKASPFSKWYGEFKAWRMRNQMTALERNP